MVAMKKILMPPAQQLVNYNFEDVARNTGYITFYPAIATNGNTIVVTDSNFVSEKNHKLSGANVTPQDWRNIFEDTIDLQFNTPKNIVGDMFFDIPISVANATANEHAAFQRYLILKAYHYDGTTETQLGTAGNAASSAIFHDAGGANSQIYKNNMAAIKINVPNVVHFKAMETLRVKLAVWAYSDDPNISAYGGVGYSPKDDPDRIINDTTDKQMFSGAFGLNFTQQKWLIPFKLDV